MPYAGEYGKPRNEAVSNNKSVNAGAVVNIASSYLTQWQRVQNMDVSNPTKPVPVTGVNEHWIKPQINRVKINCDATVFKHSAQFGVGCIARDDRGDLIYATKACFKGSLEIHVAEAIGIREALSWIKLVEGDPSTPAEQQASYCVESDCQLAVGAVSSRVTIYSPFGGIIDICRNLVDSMNNVSIVFVKRSGNRAADWLARSSSSNPGCISKGEVVPSELEHILVADLNEKNC